MNTKFLFVAMCQFVFGALVIGVAHAQTDTHTLAKQAAFVFSGEVEEPPKPEAREFVAPAGTFVVRVLDIFYVKASASVKPGDTVIVAASADAREPPPSPGSRAVFYANGWIYGKHLSVRELGRAPLDRSSARAKREVTAAKSEAEDDKTSERIAAAELVVAGKVKSIRSFDEANKRVPISEHAADWRLAEVVVAKRFKGQSEASVLVAFPNSRDVMWADSPKFNEGQEGVWILQRPRNLEEVFSSARAPVYTAIAARDFVPKSKVDHVERLIKKSAGH
jgi:hypothetical protein